MLLPVLLLLALAAAGGARADGDCVPREVHIALGRDPTEMLLSWRTTSSRPCPSRVWLHRASGPPSSAAAADAALRAKALAFNTQTTTSDPPNAVGESYLVSNSDMCGSPANARPFARHLHRARLAGLVPGAYYRYAIAVGNGGDGSSRADEPAIFGFRAAPRPGPDGTVTLAVVGDVGWSHHARSKSPGADPVLRAIAADVEDDAADAVVVVGDVAYADGDIDVWDGFMASIGGQGGAGGGEQGEQREQPEQKDDDDDDDGHGHGGRSKTPITYAALAARVPLMIAAGNHEYSYEEGWDHTDPSGGRPYTPEWRNWGNDSGGECGAMIARRFWMPRSGGGGRRAGADNSGSGSSNDAADHPLDFDLFQPPRNPNRTTANAAANGRSSSSSSSSPSDLRALPPFWYAFDYGPVHVAVVSSEHDLEPGSRQRNWLEADLRSVDRCVSPWLVIAIHRPLYVVYPHKSNRYVGDHLRASLEPLLREYRVDAAVSGHVHVYYRTCPVVAGGRETGGGSDGRCVDERDRDSGAMSGADALRMAAGSSSSSPSNNSSSSLASGQQSNHFGTVHLVVGSGGHKLSGASGDQPRWVRALFDREYGYLRLKAKGGERLVVEFVSPADEGEEERAMERGAVERRVLDRVTYEGGEHHAAACAESRARLGVGAAAPEEQVAVV